jgi:hypothetical protein
MTSYPVRPFLVVLAAVVATPGARQLSAAEAAKPESATKAAPIQPQRAPAAKSASSRGVLPDPALLDGASQPAEKKSEYGMIGDFELPGDENVRSGKVGGQQNQNPPPAGGQSANQAMGMPQGGGGAQGQQAPQGGAQQQGGAQGGAQQQGGAQAQGGQQGPNGAGAPPAGGGDPNAQPQGIQVAEIGGDPNSQSQAGGASSQGEKPSQVSIGDSAMRIDQPSNQPGVVGTQQQVAGQTQQHEKGTGSGGKGAGGANSGNRVEKGRAIPSGL